MFWIQGPAPTAAPRRKISAPLSASSAVKAQRALSAAVVQSLSRARNVNLSIRIFRSNFTTWNASFLMADGYFKIRHWGLKGEIV